MSDSPQICCDVAVVGGGPAGIAAATVAAESGRSVVLLDDNPRLGGQIWRGGVTTAKGSAKNWFARIAVTSVRHISSATVFHAEGNSLFAEVHQQNVEVAAEKIILGTGSRERFLPFPGWTLPNVMGAGAFQALLKSGLSVDGKRVVIAGTGPLLLAVASYASECGANVVCIAEQTSWSRFLQFGFSAAILQGKLGETFSLLRQIRGIPHYKNSWPIAASGNTSLESVRLSRNGTAHDISCDYLACGFHLVPSTELAQLLRCQLSQGFVSTNELQQTSQPHIYCAGEPTGIGGVELSLLEGAIAGYAAAGQATSAQKLFSRRNSARRNVRAIASAFALRDELKSLPQPGTLFCRCEDVPFERVRQHDSWRAAKLHTRCGMGPCQGRVCGSAAEFLFGWNIASPRPPLFPVACSSLSQTYSASSSHQAQGDSQ
jgi:D-hydroxyproline dehydrogenase subunit alpha